MSTAQDLPLEALAAPGEVSPAAVPAQPALRLVPVEPLDFDEAVRNLRPRLHRYAVRRLGDVHEAEELVQEALLRAYSHRDKLLTEDDVAAWSTVVTGRLVIDRLRVRGRSTSVADVPEASRVSRDTADVVVARDEARTALDALDAMPPRQAALLWAREVEGQSYEELCARFGMTEPAVRSVLTRARKALRKEYSARGGTVPVGGLAILAPWAAGLGWADKLRRATARITAPAALGAVGITALGGLVLSPFGVLAPHASVPFQPAQAIVSQLDPDPVLHGFVVRPASVAGHRSAGTPSAGDGGTSALDHLGRQVQKSVPCINDSDADDGHSTATVDGRPHSIVVAGNEIGGSAGSSRCDAAEETPHSTYVLTPRLPDNPTGFTQVSVGVEGSCAPVTPNPLVACTQQQSKAGARK